MAAEPRAIALVKLSALGDVVHATPVVEALADAFPAARLTWVAERREAALLRDHPRLDAVVMVDTRGWRRARRAGEVAGALRAMLALRGRLQRARFDVAIDLQGLLKSGLVTLATGAPVRIGFAAGWSRERLNALCTNRRVAPPPTARHVVEQYLALLRPLGVVVDTPRFRLPANPAAEARIDEFLAGAGLRPGRHLVLLNPGAGKPSKRWPAERFRALAGRLTGELGAQVLVVWGPGEEAAARTIAALPPPAPVLAPRTDLDELIALVRRAGAVVAADTGPLHIAAAVGTLCVGLYGPTSAARNGPYGPGHRTVSSPDGRMESIDVESVLGAVREALAA